MARRRIIAGNWKMHKKLQEAENTVAQIASHLANIESDHEIFIAVPSLYLSHLIEKCIETKINIGAQNCNEHIEGAYTGEISCSMLQSVGCFFTLIGHSERRQLYFETDEIIFKKIKAALRYQILPIFCCGEHLEDRNNGNFLNVIQAQIEKSLFELSRIEIEKCVIAYEPIWAIGTGLNASAEQAQEMHQFIRNLIQNKFGLAISSKVRIIYGGSLKPANAKELFNQKDIDGGLIGGASLQSEDFIKIIES